MTEHLFHGKRVRWKRRGNASLRDGWLLRRKGATRGWTCSERKELREKIWIKNHPSKETLINVFKECKSFVKMGELYNVSDKAISKWFKHYNLPFKKKELNDYINNL